MPHEQPIVIVNCLPITLAHYEIELQQVLDAVDATYDVRVVSESGDRLPSAAAKARAALSIIKQRVCGYQGHCDAVFIVVWPLFGFLDVLTWYRVARKNSVIIVYHDPKPLRRQRGTSKVSTLLFKALTRASNTSALCQTELARQALRRSTGVVATVAPHPILAPPDRGLAAAPSPVRDDAILPQKVITVLGQYKSARSTEPLIDISRTLSSEFSLRIMGKGWPDVPGWVVTDKFLDELEFQAAIDSSSCVVIPYSHFFQSGVAVRCAESNTPVVAPRHEHIEQVFGSEWPGLVDRETDWAAAVKAVCGVNVGPIDTALAFENSVQGWRGVITEMKVGKQ